MADVFISYARHDTRFVQKVHAELAKRNRDAWVDWEDIPLTAEWLAEIQRGIEAADAFVFVITPESIASAVCGQELAHAVEHHKRLVPVVRQDVLASAVPPALATLNWIFFRADDDFASAFDSLVRALDTDLEWVRAHTRLLTRALEWDRGGRNDSLVLRGSDLRAAEDWLGRAGTKKEPSPTPLQAHYILASRRVATRVQRQTLAGVSVALVLTASLAVFALVQRQEAITQTGLALAEASVRATAESNARTAELEARTEAEARATAQAIAETERNIAVSRELAVSATGQLGTDPELSILLAIGAVQQATTAQAEEALRQALVESHVRSVMRGHTAGVQRAGFSPDG